MKRRNLLAAVLSFSLVIGMSAPVDLAQESKKTQTAVSIEDSVGDTSKYGYLPIHRKLLNSDDLSSGRKKKAAKTTIPSSFDAREEGLLTNIKDQGETGMCWTMSFGILDIQQSRRSTWFDGSGYLQAKREE